MKRQLWLASFACALSLAATLFQSLFAQEVNATNPSSKADNEAATFIVFDVPCAQQYPWASSVLINAAGTVVGTCSDAAGTAHGFYRLADGTIRTFDVPGCASIGCTFPTAINSSGTIIGSYAKASESNANYPGGFLVDRLGNYTKFDAVDSGSTGPTAINSAGIITGWYVNSDHHEHAFIRDAEGNITSFDAPAF